MLKSTKLYLSLVLVLALFFIALVTVQAVFAEEAPAPETTVEEPQDEPATDEQTPETPADGETVEPPATDGTEDETAGIIDRFIENLKAKYGDDYEYYLNAILEQWGSVEAYLLAQTDNLPEEFQTGYTDFINWLSEYAPVWAPCLAVALTIIGFIVGKKALNKMLARQVEARISPIEKELNKQSEAQAAQLKATRALLGTNEKFAEERKAAETAEKNLLE